MRRVSRLANRYRTFYLRCPIPRGLQPILGCREINRSLKTTDRVTAVERLLILSLAIDRFFGELNKMIPIVQILPVEIQTALKAEIKKIVSIWPWVSVNHPAEIHTYLENFTRWTHEYEDRQHNQAACLEAGARFLQDRGLLESLGNDLSREQLVRLGYLCCRIAIFQCDYAAIRLTGGNGSEIDDPDLRALMREEAATPVLPAPKPVETPSPKQETPLSELFRLYEREMARTMKGNRAYDFKQAFEILNDAVGPGVTAEMLDKKHIRDVKRLLDVLPAHAGNMTQFKGLNYAQIAKKNEELRLKVVTDRSRNKILGCLNQLLDWATKEGFISTNPVDGMLLNLEKGKSDRLPFDAADLKRLFHAPTFVGMQSERKWKNPGPHVIRDSNYWMPILALCTGARSNELLQLTRSDVLYEGGIWIMDINKQVKTRESRRKVPLHPVLHSLGFVEWVSSSTSNPTDRLFPEVTASPNDGKFSTIYSKRFARFLTSVGVDDSRKVFHSFRHLFTDLLRAKADDGVIKAILGHEDPSVTSRYGKGYPIERLYAAIEDVILPVDLTHLYPKTTSTKGPTYPVQSRSEIVKGP